MFIRPQAANRVGSEQKMVEERDRNNDPIWRVIVRSEMTEVYLVKAVSKDEAVEKFQTDGIFICDNSDNAEIDIEEADGEDYPE